MYGLQVCRELFLRAIKHAHASYLRVRVLALGPCMHAADPQAVVHFLHSMYDVVAIPEGALRGHPQKSFFAAVEH